MREHARERPAAGRELPEDDAVPAAATGPALRNLAPENTFNMKTLYWESQNMPMSSPRLAGPIKLGLALS